MPYRGDRVGPACYRHSAASATTSCSSCARPLCEACVVFARPATECPRCAGRSKVARRVRQATLSLAGSFLLALCAGTGVFIVTHPTIGQYGVYAERIAALKQDLARDPCDRNTNQALLRALDRAGAYRALMSQAQRIREECGESIYSAGEIEAELPLADHR